MEDSDDDDAEEALREHDAANKRTRIEDERTDSAQEDTSQLTEQMPEGSNHSERDRDRIRPTVLGMSLFSQRPLPNHPTHAPVTGSRGAPVSIKTTSGKSFSVRKSSTAHSLSYERTIAARSDVVAGKAQRDYYGIDIHNLINEAKAEAEIAAVQAETRQPAAVPSVERLAPGQKQQRILMWTEKYRARKFTELVGDDRTHRSVMHWLKRWDEIVFPGSARPRNKKKALQQGEERPHRKVLLLTGPPGLGKTTLAHVCARQAGYEVQEINASDERSHLVVKGRIRDMVGTENVKNGVDTRTASGKVRQSARPVCVVVDEVDGVVGGSSNGGEGGFIKALIDLVHLDQRNSTRYPSQQGAPKKKKGDNFRLLRPLILICNDVYHPSLRPLRQSTIAEIIHVRKPAVGTVISRMQSIFDKENIPFDTDGVRKLCEAAWGITSKKDGGAGSSSTSEGDIRGILVVGEWIAGKLRAGCDPMTTSMPRLTRRWIEDNVLADLGHDGGSARGLGRGGAKEVVERVFQEGAGFARSTLASASSTKSATISGVKGVAEAHKRATMARLAEMINTSDSSDRIMTDCYSAYPEQPYQDDTFLSKPDQAYEWLHFHDTLSSQVFGSAEWELAPYLSTPILAFHNLFATPTHSRNAIGASSNWDKNGGDEASEEEEPVPFSGPQASYQAHEARKHNVELLESLRSSLSLPLTRTYMSSSDLAVEFVPYLTRMLGPNINPVVVGTGSEKATASVRKASEKALVNRAVNAMMASGVHFERSRVEFDGASSGPGQNGGWIYRMEPALDEVAVYATMAGVKKGGEGVRFAVRQVLDQEFSREVRKASERSRTNRFAAGGGIVSSSVIGRGAGEENEAAETAAEKRKVAAVKRDFFGRVIAEVTAEEMAEEAELGREGEGARKRRKRRNEKEGAGEEGRIWVTFHEGFSNAVRKPISLGELMRGL